jgi:hypothetical protein
MRALGWILLVVGLLWAFGGVYNVGAAFMGGVNAPTDAARQQASMATAVSLLLNGLLFILPGLVVAGIGGLLARRATRRQMAEGDDAERVPCPHCSEPILRAAKICRFCGRDVVPARVVSE